MNLSVETLSWDGDLGDWQRFVDARPDAGPLHHAGWLKVIAEAFAVMPHWLMARNAQGAVVGVLPLYESRSLLFGSELTSLGGGILAAGDAAVAALFEAAERIRRERRLPQLVLRGGALPAVAPAGTRSHVHTLILTRHAPEDFLALLPKQLRWEVRKAEREGVSVVTDPDLLPAFYDVYARTLRRLGTPVMTRRYFDAIAGHLAGHIRFFAVLDRGRFAGGMLAIDHGRMRSNFYAAVEDQSMRRYANYALYRAAIEDCCRSPAIDSFDLGRSVAGSGTHQFKRKWPSQDVSVGYACYGEPLPETPRSGSTGLKQKIWSRLPLVLCNRLGPLLRRSQPFG